MLSMYHSLRGNSQDAIMPHHHSNGTMYGFDQPLKPMQKMAPTLYCEPNRSRCLHQYLNTPDAIRNNGYSYRCSSTEHDQDQAGDITTRAELDTWLRARGRRCRGTGGRCDGCSWRPPICLKGFHVCFPGPFGPDSSVKMSCQIPWQSVPTTVRGHNSPFSCNDCIIFWRVCGKVFDSLNFSQNRHRISHDGYAIMRRDETV